MNQIQYDEKKLFHNIYCVGRNYTAFAEEMGNKPTETPIVFMKPTHSIAFMNDRDICLEPSGDILNGEAEIVLSIGRAYEKGISIEKLVDKMTIGIDFTYRKRLNKVKDKGQPWLPAKGFSGGAALGEFKQFSLMDIQSKEFSMLLNGKTAQVSSASQMIFSLQQTSRLYWK
ncbi:fumarylacetoacetate hydrolase family protein [Bacillus sp. JJ1521]|uniref:fumarylacetoacetate hydrolase family protein n=1 Tax=Bacillus sp. JJ1521 TaxID=3122957 RepID=UPI003000B860